MVRNRCWGGCILSLSQLPAPTAAYLLILAGLLGLVMGSALHCLAYRLAREQKWSGGRSVCPKCGHTLGALELIPLFSWLIQRGKCRHCGDKISWRYPASEVLLALVFVSVLWRFGLSLQTVSALVFCACLFALSIVDLEIQIIPDRFLLIPAVVRIAQLLYEGGFSGLWTGIWPGLAIGGGILALSLVMDKVLHKESMGGGDIKLLAVLGLYLSFPECLLMLVIACVAGLIIALLLQKAKPDTPFPFGPALSLAGWLTLLFGSGIVNWYLALF